MSILVCDTKCKVWPKESSSFRPRGTRGVSSLGENLAPGRGRGGRGLLLPGAFWGTPTKLGP